MSWSIEILGDPNLLKEFSEIICSSDFRIVYRDDTYFVESDYFYNHENIEEIREWVGKYLNDLNYAAHLLKGIKVPVGIGSITKTHDGNRIIFAGPHQDQIILNDESTIKRSKTKARLIDKNGNDITPHPSNDIKNLFDVVRKDSNVSKALNLIAAKPRDWNNLYKLLHLIEDDMGGFKEIKMKRWASVRSLERIHHSAVSYEVAGMDSRKLTQRIDPPKKPIILKHGWSIMMKVFHDWWRWKYKRLCG